MATTYSSTQVTAAVPAKYGVGFPIEIYGEYVGTAAIVINDIIQMVKVPAGFRVHDVIGWITDVDTDGAPAVVLEVGDGVDTDRYITGSTVGQAGGRFELLRVGANIGAGWEYTAEDTIDIKFTTAPATSVTAYTVRLIVRGECNPII